MSDPKPSNDLLSARRAIDGIPELRLRSDLTWQSKARRWAVGVDVRLEIATPYMPATSSWFFALEGDYPLGTIKAYPAHAGGIVATFPHQERNGLGAGDRPWRVGAPCLDASVTPLGRVAGETEPRSAEDRLAWHARRLVRWCRHAAAGTLQYATDPYELPAMPDSARDLPRLAFREDPASFETWSKATPGSFGFFEWSPVAPWIVVRRFVSANGQIISAPGWGNWLREETRAYRGAWVVLPAFPVLPPWGVPSTFGELRAVLDSMDLVLDAIVARAIRIVRHEPEALLMIGHPMPSEVGGPPIEMNWLSIELPCWNASLAPRGRLRGRRRLPSRTAPPRGVRIDPKSLWAYDRSTSYRDPQQVIWRRTENLAEHRLRARGALDTALTRGPILLVGGGALGSLMAEGVVRGGAQDVTIYDGENLDAGNLCRHTLSLLEVDQPKARALARHLTALSPSLRITGIPDTIRGDRKAFTVNLRKAHIVLDCTGADDVLDTLAGMGPQGRTIDWFSMSLGLVGRRLFVFHARADAFPASAFYALIEPWLPSEATATRAARLPREGIGCWHPLFPARIDQVAMASAVGIRRMHEMMSAHSERSPTLDVFEESVDAEGVFTGFLHVQSPS